LARRGHRPLYKAQSNRVAAGRDKRQTLSANQPCAGPAHGDTAFTVPLFDGFMKRIMPAL
jgi:hypothetical protein